jgi:hypothetical protein
VWWRSGPAHAGRRGGVHVCLSVCLFVSWCVHAAAVYSAIQHRSAKHVRVRCEQVLRMLQEGFGYHIRLIDSMVRVWVWRRLVG